MSLGSDGSDVDDEDDEVGPGKQVDEDADENDEDANDSDALSLAEHSSAASLVALSDIELPEGLIGYNSGSENSGQDEDQEEWGGFNSDGAKGKRKRKAEKGGIGSAKKGKDERH